MKNPPALIVLLILACALAPLNSTAAQLSFVPHEDPATVPSIMDSYSFLIEYSNAFALMANREYSDAAQLNEQLSHMTVPEELSYIVQRYNQLTQQLIDTLNDVQGTLDRAQSFLNQYRLNEASQALDKAGILIAKAQILLSDLQEATATLKQRLGIGAAAVESKIQQAYDRIQNLLEKLRELINQYRLLLQRFNRREQEIRSENLTPTALSLSLNTTRCFVGRYISAHGTLTCNGEALPNRVVQLLFNGKQVEEATTRANGEYTISIQIPYNYVSSIAVSALYVPEGNDQGIYLAAASPTVQLQVQFYRSHLAIEVPQFAYPGLSLTIRGNVTAEDGTPQNQRQIKVFLDGTQKAQIQTTAGAFTVKFTLAPQTQIGNHTLTVTVEPKDIYAGATQRRTVTVQQMATNLEFSAPSFILLPTQLQIAGSVNSSQGPLQDAAIELDFANITATTKTQSDGKFNLTVEVPLNTALAGYQQLTLKTQPTQPWQTAAQAKTNIFALNSVSTGLAVVSSLSVFTLAFMRFTKTKTKTKENLTPTLTSTKQPQIARNPPLPLRHVEFEGAKGTILKAYLEAQSVVETATGNILTANMTLREYTALTAAKIQQAAEPFSELTTLTEKSLYSPHEPKQEEAQHASDLTSTIRRTLSHGNP